MAPLAVPHTISGAKHDRRNPINHCILCVIYMKWIHNGRTMNVTLTVRISHLPNHYRHMDKIPQASSRGTHIYRPSYLLYFMFKRILSCLMFKCISLRFIPVLCMANFGSGRTQLSPNRLGVILLAVKYKAAIKMLLHEWKMEFRLHKSCSFLFRSASLPHTVRYLAFWTTLRGVACKTQNRLPLSSASSHATLLRHILILCSRLCLGLSHGSSFRFSS